MNEDIITEDIVEEEVLLGGDTFNLDDILAMTGGQEMRLNALLSKTEFDNGSSKEESKERTKLIFLKQANLFKRLATDKYIDKESDENYAELAEKNYIAYLK